MPCPGAGVRHRGPTGLRNPRRGGSADGTTKALVGRLAGARCPALRSAGLFGSETGSPRTRVAFLRHGYLVAGVVGGPNPACGPHAKKSLRPKPQKNCPRRGRSGKTEAPFRSTAPVYHQKRRPGAAQRPAKAPAGAAPAKQKAPSGAPPLFITKKEASGVAQTPQKGLKLRLFFLCRGNKFPKQRVRTVGAAFEFRVKLHAHKPGMMGVFDHFNQSAVR